MASNKLLDAFVSQYKIKMENLHGKSVEVSQEVTKQWKSQMSSFWVGYSFKDIYYCDKTGICFWAVPSRNSVWQDEALLVTMVWKDWLTVLITCSDSG